MHSGGANQRAVWNGQLRGFSFASGPKALYYSRRVRNARQREEHEALVELCRSLRLELQQLRRAADWVMERARQLRAESRAACAQSERSREGASRRWDCPARLTGPLKGPGPGY